MGLLSDVAAGSIVLLDNPLDSHDERYNFLAITLKYLFMGLNAK